MTLAGLAAGQQYEVQFLQWGDDITDGSFSASLDVDGSTILSYEYTNKPFGTAEPIIRKADFIAAGSAVTLVFGASSGGASPVIDDIQISSVPLPPAYSLLVSAVAGHG